MKKNIKKIVSLILVCVMTFSLAYVPAKAATNYETTLTIEGSGWYGTNANGSSNVLYVHGSDTYLTTEGEEWNAANRFLIADDDNSGVFVGDEKLQGISIRKFLGGVASNNLPDVRHMYYIDGITASAGTVITIKGNFTTQDGTAKFVIAKSQFKWTGSIWEDYYETTLTIEGSGWYGTNANGSSNELYVHGSDTYLATEGEVWNAANRILIADDENSGVFVGDEKMQGVSIQKWLGGVALTNLPDVRHMYYIKGITASAGTVITIKGNFTTQDGKAKFVIAESQFKWTGSIWEDYEESVEETPSYETTLTIEGSGWYGTNANGNSNEIYVHGSDTYLATEGEVWNAANRILIADDENSGVFVGDEKMQGVSIQKWLGGVALTNLPDVRHMYYIKGITASAGTVITIKGNFTTQDGTAKFVIAESQFKWTGSIWEDFDGNAGVKFTSLAVDKDYLAPNKASGAGWAIWQFYLKTNYNVTTNLEYPINYKIGDGNTVYTTTVTDLSDNDNVFYSKIDQDKIDEANGTTITYLAGEYTATADSTQTMIITEDFTFHVNQYGWSTVEEKITPDLTNKVTLTHAPTIDNGGGAGGFYLLADCEDGMSLSEDWTKHLTPVALSPEDTYYTSVGEGGLWKNGAKTDVKITKFTYVDKPCYYVHASAEAGATYIVKGLFEDTTGRKVAYQPIKVTYKNGAWQQVYVGLTDSGVQHDVNSDLDVNSVDLVRLMRHRDNNMISINDEQKDINYSGAFDKYDVDSLRKVLVGMIYYKNGEVYGTPIYNDNKVIEKTAYAGPEVGTWNAEGTEFTPYSDEEIDATFQKYKAAGLTLLNTENVAVYQDNTWDSEVNEPIRVYLEAAERNGLGVLVWDGVIQYMLTQKDPEIYGAGTAWQGVIENHIITLQQYDSFRGFMVWDELSVEYLDTYNKIVSYIREAHPELILLTSQYPVTAYNVDGLGASALTKDTQANNTKQKAYEDYVWSYAQANKHFVFDLYPLIYSADKFFGSVTDSEYGVQEDWYLNLQYVANQVKEHNYSFTTGITIQSSRLTGTNTLWSQYERYLPEQTADIGFQVYTAMSYGMKEIHYFTWRDHWSAEEVDGGMSENESVYNAVSAVNAEIDKFANVYQSFSWKDTLDLAAGTTNSSTGNSRLTSAKAETARAFVGCMKDTDGFDGYMVSNAAGPRENVTSRVTLTFNDATQAIVYTDGVPKTVALTDGVCTVEVPSGEGVFVIPLR